MKVLINDSIAREGVEILRNEGFYVEETHLEPNELKEKIKNFDALIVRSATKVTADILENAENLKVIGRAGVGLDNIDVEAARSKGIIVINTPEATTTSVAELTIALIFSLARAIPRAHMSVKGGRWEKKLFKGIELRGKTLGIIGLGRIGREVALKAKCLGMRVVAHDKQQVDTSYAESVSFEELLRISDFISLHVPLTPETKHLIGEKELGCMKNTAFLINTSRGGVVDEEALYNFLKAGKLRGAALDVFEIEPPLQSKLLELDNIIFTPHIGAQTEEGQRRAGIEVAKKIVEILKQSNG